MSTPERFKADIEQTIYVPGLGAFKRGVDKVTGKVTVAPINLDEKTTFKDLYPAKGNGYIMRETGLSRTIDKNNRIIDALAEPNKYLINRNQEIVKMEKDLNDAYISQFQRAIELGYSDEEAKKKAMRYVQFVKDEKLKDIDKDYPLEAVDVAKKRLLKKNN